jgi:hypothetical protein
MVGLNLTTALAVTTLYEWERELVSRLAAERLSAFCGATTCGQTLELAWTITTVTCRCRTLLWETSEHGQTARMV